MKSNRPLKKWLDSNVLCSRGHHNQSSTEGDGNETPEVSQEC